jgi:hypothetical protein
MIIEFQSLYNLIRDMVRLIRGSVESQSETISDHQVESWIHQYRALLIKQDLDKNKASNPDYIQEIKGLRLYPVDSVEIPNLSVNKFVLRTVLKVPKTLDLNFKQGFTYIGTIDGKEIQIIAQGRSYWQQFREYTSKEPICYSKNQYLYVISDTLIEYIDVRGVFEIPTEVANFNNPVTGIPYYSYTDDKYPLPSNWIPILKKMILEKEFNIMVNSLSDSDNDSNNKVSSNVSHEK